MSLNQTFSNVLLMQHIKKSVYKEPIFKHRVSSQCTPSGKYTAWVYCYSIIFFFRKRETDRRIEPLDKWKSKLRLLGLEN